MIDLQIFLDKNCGKNEKILLACSTGPDSMFLLHKTLQTSFKNNIVSCYFNHKLREEAEEEEQFLLKLGKELGFQVEIGEANIKKIKENLNYSVSIEELAREKRYEFFGQICKKYNATKIFLAHHLDDKIETFIFNLLRGSKLTGLINMTEKSGNILRPFLSLEKAEMLRYLNENNLKYFVDKTNYDNNISRNFLRNEIIPQFYKINLNFKNNIDNTLNYFEELKKYIDTEVINFLNNQNEKNSFEINNFNSCSIFLQKEIIRYVYYISNGNSTIGLSKENISEIIKFINGKNNKTIKEIKNLKMKKDGNRIYY